MATAVVEMSMESLSKHQLDSFGSHVGPCDSIKTDQLCSIAAALTQAGCVPNLPDDNLLECQSMVPNDELSYLCSHGAKLVLEETDSPAGLDLISSSSDGMVHSTETSETDSQQQMMMRQKRKPDDPGAVENEEHHHTSLHLYHLTLSKLLSSPTRRIEPSLQRSVVMRNTLKELENQVFSHTPSKRINLDMGPNLYITSSQDMDSEPVSEVSETRVYNKLDSEKPAEYTELVTASCQSTTDFSLPSEIDDHDNEDSKDFSSQLYFHFPPLPTLPLICNNTSKADPQADSSCCTAAAEAEDEESMGYRMDSSDEDSNSSDNSDGSMDVTSPTSPTIEKKSSAVFCTAECQRPLLSVAKSALGHTDELDSIMQVLVSM